MARQADEVTAAEVLEDARIVLLLLDLAVVVPGNVVLRIAGRGEGRRIAARDVAEVVHAEDAIEGAFERIAVGNDVAVARRRRDAGLTRGHTGADVDRAADGRGGRAVDVGDAEVDVHFFENFAVHLLVGVERIVARIVQGQAVEGLRDAVGGEAADGEATARGTPGVVVLEADTRDEVDDVVDRLAGALTTDDFLVEDLLGLRRIGNFHAADIGVGRSGDDNRFIVFEVDRAGRLRVRDARNDGTSGKHAGAEKKFLHGFLFPPTGGLK